MYLDYNLWVPDDYWVTDFKTLILILQSYFIFIFNHLMLCLATAIHNLKWLEITHITD